MLTLESRMKWAAAVLILLSPLMLRAEIVFVSAQKKGTGITRKRGVDCYVLTPKHLVENYSDEVTVVGPNDTRGSATVRLVYPTLDLAILQIDSPNAPSLCTEPWPETEQFEYSSQSNWTAWRANNDGSTSPTILDFAEADPAGTTFTFRQHGPDNPLFEGLSGSVVRAGNRVVGMLYQIHSGHNPPEADAHSWRHLDAIVRDFFERTGDWKELPPLPAAATGASSNGVLGKPKPVQALEIYNGRLIAGTYGGGIYRFDESEHKWADISGKMRGRKLLCLHSMGVALLATFDSYGSSDGGYAISEDGGNWFDLGLPGFIVQTVRNEGVRLHLGAYGGYYAGVAGNVQDHNKGLLAGTVCINALEVVPEGVFAGLGPRIGDPPVVALAFLKNGTAEWSPIPEFKNLDVHTLTSNAQYVFAGTTTNGVFRVRHDGTGVEPANAGLPTNHVVQVLAAIGSKVFAGTKGRGVWVSTDDGAHWAEFNNELSRNSFVLSLKEGTERVVYAGTQDGKVFQAGY